VLQCYCCCYCYCAHSNPSRPSSTFFFFLRLRQIPGLRRAFPLDLPRAAVGPGVLYTRQSRCRSWEPSQHVVFGPATLQISVWAAVSTRGAWWTLPVHGRRPCARRRGLAAGERRRGPREWPAARPRVSPALAGGERGQCVFYATSTGFIDDRRFYAQDMPLILFTHIPLYRPSDSNCGPLREKGIIPFVHGEGYQTLLNPETSQLLLDELQPTLIFR
jgi:hypothetical protein